MRQGQASIEVAAATLLLVMIVAAAWVVASSAWIRAEVVVANVASTQAAYRGHDPQAAALAAVPPWARAAVARHIAHRQPRSASRSR